MNINCSLFVLLSFFISSCVMFPTCIQDPCTPIPGNSRAIPKDQTIAAGSLFETAKAYVPGCKDFKVVNTEYKGVSGYEQQEEIWTIEGCGQKFKKNIKFGPNGNVGHGLFLEKVK